MSFGSNSRRGLASKVITGKVTTAPWKRNPSWSALPSVISTDEKFVGLYAVWPDSNYVALTAAGNYNIDFGDGSASQNIATGVQVNYQILYSAASLVGTEKPVTFTAATSLVTINSHGYVNGDKVQFWNIVTTTGINSAQTYYVVNVTTNTFQFSTSVNGAVIAFTNNGTGSLLPYRQAIITVTPQSGQQLTALNLNIKNTATGLQTGYSTGWLDIALSMPNCSASGLVINASVQNVKHGYLQQASIVNAGGLTTATYMFFNCYALQSIVQFNNTLITDMSYMFQSCYALQTVPLFNTAAVTAMNSMFQSCYALQTVPLFNTAAVTTMLSMFFYCYALQTVPLFNTAAVTNMSSMFSSCYSLQTVPLFNTAAVTDMSVMFANCYTIQTVPLFNTAAVINMGAMFLNCYALQTVPLFNTATVTGMGGLNAGMFMSCYSLQTVPLFNTAAVTYMQNMFSNCFSLQTVPLFNTAAVTNMSSMFSNCYELQIVPAFSFAAILGTNLVNMFQNCYSLQAIPAFNCSPTAISLFPFSTLPSVSASYVTNAQITHSYGSDKLSAAAINNIFTNLPTVTGKTITILGNPGGGTCTPSIATAKGWTVA